MPRWPQSLDPPDDASHAVPDPASLDADVPLTAPEFRPKEMHPLKVLVPEYLFTALRREHQRRAESMATIIREALHEYLGFEGRTLARIRRGTVVPVMQDPEAGITGEYEEDDAPSPFPTPSPAPPPSTPPTTLKVKAKVRKAEPPPPREDDIVLHPSVTGLPKEIRIPFARARAVWKHLPAPGNPWDGENDEQTARRVAPLAGLGVLEVMELLALLGYDDDLITKLETAEAHDQESRDVASEEEEEGA